MFTIASFIGLPELTTNNGTVFPGLPSAKAGIMPGEKMLAVEGRLVSRWMEHHPDRTLRSCFEKTD